MEDQVYVTKGGESFLEFIGFFEENVKRLGYLRILIPRSTENHGVRRRKSFIPIQCSYFLLKAPF